jgi:hypothetical protein
MRDWLHQLHGNAFDAQFRIPVSATSALSAVQSSALGAPVQSFRFKVQSCGLRALRVKQSGTRRSQTAATGFYQTNPCAWRSTERGQLCPRELMEKRMDIARMWDNSRIDPRHPQ